MKMTIIFLLFPVWLSAQSHIGQGLFYGDESTLPSYKDTLIWPYEADIIASWVPYRDGRNISYSSGILVDHLNTGHISKGTINLTQTSSGERPEHIDNYLLFDGADDDMDFTDPFADAGTDHERYGMVIAAEMVSIDTTQSNRLFTWGYNDQFVVINAQKVSGTTDKAWIRALVKLDGGESLALSADTVDIGQPFILVFSARESTRNIVYINNKVGQYEEFTEAWDDPFSLSAGKIGVNATDCCGPSNFKMYAAAIYDKEINYNEGYTIMETVNKYFGFYPQPETIEASDWVDDSLMIAYVYREDKVHHYLGSSNKVDSIYPTYGVYKDDPRTVMIRVTGNGDHRGNLEYPLGWTSPNGSDIFIATRGGGFGMVSAIPEFGDSVWYAGMGCIQNFDSGARIFLSQRTGSTQSTSFGKSQTGDNALRVMLNENTKFSSSGWTWDNGYIFHFYAGFYKDRARFAQYRTSDERPDIFTQTYGFFDSYVDATGYDNVFNNGSLTHYGTPQYPAGQDTGGRDTVQWDAFFGFWVYRGNITWHEGFFIAMNLHRLVNKY
jgi:hypothetical protein